jgi:hypothetical protein
MKPKRDKLIAFLLARGACAKGVRKYRGLTPKQAWDKAAKNGELGNLPMEFHSVGYSNCWCSKEKPKMPAKLMADYRAFKVTR